ncbi:MAG: F420-non-reducing hydrogenase vhc subunit G [Candidatus Thorarchaeota archaeon AB_25]|nr:MAG: F420-non-reducing hydrogenase vhc subunit G [Candidatus Thorarchaeota archaeon AB_25]
MVKTKRIALTQLTSCWGCDQALVDLHLKLLDVLPALDIVYWPAVVDYKLHDLEAMPKNSIHIGLVEGSCRTKEDLHLLKVMREKSKILVAWGSCSAYGGVQGLGNQWDLQELLDRKFLKADTVTDGRIPDENLPGFTQSIIPNPDIVPVDLVLPGCPPTSENTLEALVTLLENKPYDLPDKTVCDQCPMEREEKRITQFRRTYEGKIDPTKCLLDQGYLCLGFATIGLCGAQCPTVATPCKGCFGPPPTVKDHGAKIISALGAIADMTPEELKAAFPDPIGSFYFTDYASSYLSKIRDQMRREEK